MRNSGPANRPRIWFLNRSYWPDCEATGQLLTELCEDLAADFDVSVFTGSANHAQPGDGEDAVRRRGVTIHRLPHTRFPKASFAGRMSNLATFTAAAFVATLIRTPPDLVVTQTDPFFLPLLGRWLRVRYRCRFVAVLQDIYPDVAISLGLARESWATRRLRRALVAACQRADRVVVVGDDMHARCRRNGIDPRRLTILHNWADCDRIVPEKRANAFRERHGWRDKFLVMYSGNFGRAHLLAPILEAARRLQYDPDVQFVLIGEGVQKPELVARAGRLQLANVSFLPYQPREFLAHSLSAANLQVVSLKAGAAGCVMPSKLYGIMASGTPVLAICPSHCDLAHLIRGFEMGRVCPVEGSEVEPGESLATAIVEMRSDPALLARQGGNARRAAVNHFSRASQTAKFKGILSAVLSRSASGDKADSDAAGATPMQSGPHWRRVTDRSHRDGAPPPILDHVSATSAASSPTPFSS